MRKCAVYLLAENRLLREALIRLLSKNSEVRVIGSNPYSSVVHREIISARPQILLMDSGGTNDIRPTLIATLRSAIRNLRIVMVDMESNEDAFLDAVRAGVVGYVLKNASALEVAAAIRVVAAGKAVCPPCLCLALFRCVTREAAPPSLGWGLDLGLSRREQEIAELLRYRNTNKEIALRLNLSEQTIKNHVHHILRKLNLPNRLSICELYQKRQTKSRLNSVSYLAGEKNYLASINTPEMTDDDRQIAKASNSANNQN